MIDTRTARAFVLAVLSFSCGGRTEERGEHAQGGAPAPGAQGDVADPTLLRPRTTTGALAVRNLNGRVLALETRLRAQPSDLDAAVELVQHYLLRADYLGTLTDYGRAEALAERVAATPGPRGLALRARVRGALHRFPSAFADLDAAVARGLAGAAERQLRANLLLAVGRIDEAAALAGVPSLGATEADETTRGAAASGAAARGAEALQFEAAIEDERGRPAAAAALYAEARAAMRTTLPFPVAWTELQEGLTWERAGEHGRARERFEVAHTRLPQYAAATSHLAAALARSGETTRAAALLAELVQRSDDPEHLAQLAEVVRRQGRAAEADALVVRARDGYERLLALHPAAFADHAARFFLAGGADPARALELAELNLRGRQPREAYELVIDAALAASRIDRACGAADAALAALAAQNKSSAAGIPVRLRVAAWRAYSACGRAADAARIDPQVEDAARDAAPR